MLAGSGIAFERLHDALPNASRRNVDDPSEAHIVVRIQNQLQIGEGVFDFFSLVETHAADDLVWRASPAECILERARLRVSAIQDRDGVFGILVQRRP